MAEQPLLAAHDITRYYHGRQVLYGIDIILRRGEVLALLGPNGAGKSTTMNILSGVLAPHGGEVTINGIDLARQAELAKAQIGYLPEVPPLHVDATVQEYLSFCAALRGVARRQIATTVARAMEECDLGSVRQRLIGNLSKGFRQRVGIAQAILHRPAVVILDEPTSGLDPNQIRSVRATIELLAERHAVILSTHVLSEAQALCRRAMILHHGRIAFDDDIEQHNESLVLRLAAPPPAATLARLDFIHASETLDDGRLRLRVTDFDSAAEQLAQLAVAQGWGLRELGRESSTLEQVFVDITCNDTVAFA